MGTSLLSHIDCTPSGVLLGSPGMKVGLTPFPWKVCAAPQVSPTNFTSSLNRDWSYFSHRFMDDTLKANVTIHTQLPELFDHSNVISFEDLERLL